MNADEAEARIDCLIELGFGQEDADHVYETIALPAPEVIRQKLADLRSLGFADPVKMVTSSPAILGYAIDNIRTKLADLRSLGFADPVKIVTSLPAILGLAIDNIRTKLADLRSLGFADPVKMVTSSPVILSYARERILLCGTILAGISDREDKHLLVLLFKKRTVIDAVAAAKAATWKEVTELFKQQKSVSLKIAA